MHHQQLQYRTVCYLLQMHEYHHITQTEGRISYTRLCEISMHSKLTMTNIVQNTMETKYLYFLSLLGSAVAGQLEMHVPFTLLSQLDRRE